MVDNSKHVAAAWDRLTPLDEYAGKETAHLRVITWDQLVQIAHALPPTQLYKKRQHPQPDAAAIRLVAEFYAVEDHDIIGQSRKGKHSLPRKMACLLMRDIGEMSYDEIGHVLNRDHTTILYLVRSAQEMCNESPSHRTVYLKLRQVLKKFVDQQKYGDEEEACE